eukprot:363550-Chlamydomonas_euryale.AAC.1
MHAYRATRDNKARLHARRATHTNKTCLDACRATSANGARACSQQWQLTHKMRDQWLRPLSKLSRLTSLRLEGCAFPSKGALAELGGLTALSRLVLGCAGAAQVVSTRACMR